MRIIKRHSLLKPANNYVIDAPQPSNISYWWNIGSLLGLSLGIQIITGVTLAMHYNPNVLEAFNSVEHIMRDVNSGWLIRYLHANTASAFFFLVYLHIGRGLYYGSYKAPRSLTWTIGTTIFILMMATAFLGYVLPYGQMSLWGATVITNLMSAIPWIGQDIVEFVWGGFSVNNATLNRFFSLHFVLPFILAALALMHLIALHDSAGSNNPLGVSGNYDRVAFAPYFIFKDVITIFIFMWVLSLFVFFLPNFLGDSENYVMANPMQTPPAIVPEWYLLPFYAILRSIPNKLIGVIAMFSAILMILVMTFGDLSKLRGIEFKPLNKTIFFIFVGNLLFLMVLGAKHVESPYIEIGQMATLLYFFYFIFTIPLSTIFENSINEFYTNKVNSSKLLKSSLSFSYKVWLTLLSALLVFSFWGLPFRLFSVLLGNSRIFIPVIVGFSGVLILIIRNSFNGTIVSARDMLLTFVKGSTISGLVMVSYIYLGSHLDLFMGVYCFGHALWRAITSYEYAFAGQTGSTNANYSSTKNHIKLWLLSSSEGSNTEESADTSSWLGLYSHPAGPSVPGPTTPPYNGGLWPRLSTALGSHGRGPETNRLFPDYRGIYENLPGPIASLENGTYHLHNCGILEVVSNKMRLFEPFRSTSNNTGRLLEKVFQVATTPVYISSTQCGIDENPTTWNNIIAAKNSYSRVPFTGLRVKVDQPLINALKQR